MIMHIISEIIENAVKTRILKIYATLRRNKEEAHKVL